MRVKRSVNAKKKRRKTLKSTKGFLGIRKSSYRKAKEAAIHAGKYSYRDRRTKKRRARALWQIKISNAVRAHELSYSKFMAILKEKEIELDRKVLAQIAENYPEVFAGIVKLVKK